MRETIKKRLRQLSPMKIILLGFCLIILTGTLLLHLPIASKTPGNTSISDCFFTATSATCVTGLVRFDTYTHWTGFGQAVILALIQIGGMGFMTFVVSIISLTKRKIGLNTRVITQNSLSVPQVGGIVRLTKRVFVGTILFEAIGAGLLYFYFCPILGPLKGLWFSVFHSVSAFCNAGFDLMGSEQNQFASLTGVADNVYFNVIIMLLIIIGGLGFIVWNDLATNRFHFKKLMLHSKVVLIVTGILIFGGALAIFLFEQNGSKFDDASVGNQILYSMFQSVTARTAGFNSVDMGAMTQSSQFVLIILMLIGGSSGSTAGGMKTTTFAVMFMSILSIFRRKKSVEMFDRRVDSDTVQTASCIFTIYIALSVIIALIVASIEKITVIQAMFESVSAIATVGLTLGVTPTLSFVSKMLIAFLMLFGRVGSVTMLLAFSNDKNSSVSKLPLGKIQVG